MKLFNVIGDALSEALGKVLGSLVGWGLIMVVLLPVFHSGSVCFDPPWLRHA